MYSYIIGDVKTIGEDFIVLENNGIGYMIQASARTIAKYNINETYKVHTAYILRDDGVFLYGFYSKEELDMFYMLTSVSSIGPKNGLSILSTLSVLTIKLAIINNDIKTLSQAPGVGKKTASRIILELSDKIKDVEISPEELEEDKEEVKSMDNYKIAMDALINLGYTRNDATKALAGLDVGEMELQDIIKLALKSIG